ncbi:MAG: 3-oxoacyl-[acyl-carrier-protein] reductase [Acidobacteriota bacterium]
MRFKEKVSIVTGAAQGIGKEIAVSLAQEGASLALVDMNRHKLFETVEEIKKMNGDAEAFVTDVSKKEEVEKTVNEIEQKFNKIDHLVNNAGITKDNLLLRMSEDEWDKVLDVNLKGTFLFTKSVLKYMLKNRYGKIVSISSVVGIIGNAGQANYSASKAGIIGFSRSLAREVSSKGINVNVVAPGYIETEMTKSLPDSIKETFFNLIPMKRFGTPKEVANVVLFLLSDESIYINGEVIHVNGGLFMG